MSLGTLKVPGSSASLNDQALVEELFNGSTGGEVPRIIGLTGRAQHGKNTIGDILEVFGYRQMAFAAALKELALRVDPIIHAPACAATPTRLRGVVATLGWEEAKKDHPEVRRILQELGVGVRDVLGENAWVSALVQQLMPGERYCITDVRFPNEARAVTNLYGEVWKVVRPNFDSGVGTDHPSEQHVDSMKAQVTFRNDGTILDLLTQVKRYIGARGLL